MEGNFYGMGYIPTDVPISDIGIVKDHLTTYRENSFIRNLVNGYAARFPDKVIMLETISSQSIHRKFSL